MSSAVARVLCTHARLLQAEATLALATATIVTGRADALSTEQSRELGLVIASLDRQRGVMHGALSRRMGTVLTATDAVSGLGRAIAEQPDITLIDDRLLTMSGLDASYLVREYAPRCRVVLLTDDATSVAVATLNGIITSPLRVSRRRLTVTIDDALAA